MFGGFSYGAVPFAATLGDTDFAEHSDELAGLPTPIAVKNRVTALKEKPGTALRTNNPSTTLGQSGRGSLLSSANKAQSLPIAPKATILRSDSPITDLKTKPNSVLGQRQEQTSLTQDESESILDSE